MSARPTLLVFTLGPAVESWRHRLLGEGQRREEVGLRQACLEGAVRAGQDAGCQVTICSPNPLQAPRGAGFLRQREGAFGQRLAAAVRDLLAPQSGPLVVVATDVPELAERHVASALSLLDEDRERIVLGASPDGGIYLLALGQPIAGLAESVRWGGRHVLADLLALCHLEGRPVEILTEALRDLDRPADLERWLASNPATSPVGRWIVQSLRRILALRRRPPSPTRVEAPPATRLSPSAGRAPPLPATA